MDTLLNDFRYALRQLRRSPGFTLVALLSLALGLGANTTIFSVVNSLLFRPMPVARPEEMVRVYDREHSPFDFAGYSFLREHNTVFTRLVAERSVPVAMVDGGGASERAQVSLVNSDFFPALGLRPATGSLFVARHDERPGPTPEAVLGHAFWRRRFAGDSAVVGRRILLNGGAFTIVGVAPAAFTSSVYGQRADLWVPLAESRTLLGVGADEVGGDLYLAGRLRPDATPGRAETQVRALLRQLAVDRGRDPERAGGRVQPPRGLVAELRGSVTGGAVFLLGAVGLVLLIACANVANLLLARNAARRRELGVRLALGAGRGRLVRQLLTESVLLATLGGVLAVFATAWTADLLTRFVPADQPVSFDFSPDRRVALYAAALCTVTALAFGLAPALRATSPDLVTAIKDDSAQGGSRRSRLRSGVLAAQISLCTVLLACASLFLHSLRNARVIDPGFDTTRLLDAEVDLSTRQYGGTQRLDFFTRLLEHAKGSPGVRAASLAATVPLTGNRMETSFAIVGRESLGDMDGRRGIDFNVVAPDYFATLGVPVLRGRAFTAADRDGSPRVVVVNEALARQDFAGHEVIGRRIAVGGDAELEVVGVVKTIRYNTLGERPTPMVFVPLAQHPDRARMTLHVRTADGASVDAVAAALAGTIHTLDPALPPVAVKRIDEDQAVVLLPARAAAGLLGAFGGLALVLSTVGIYGVAAYAVAQRTREIAVRSALGARARDVLRAVLADTMRVVAVGGGIGLLLAFGASFLLASQLYGVAVGDPLTFVATPILLVLVVLVAGLIPASRAVGVDPVVALRAE